MEYEDQVAMEKLLSRSDATNKRFDFPTKSLKNFPMPAGQNYLNLVALDMLGQPRELKISVRKEGIHKKPWMSGRWRRYVLEKGLKKGDRVKLTMQVRENGVRSYRIKAERNLTMGIWIPIEEYWQARNGKD
ncbi:unnamed protein product [Dovyalis caffra]|uniref:TF-B3 domain-containing protein n=1 Tax=Dovyalis caffra TaxID=77055 RepID=A0AAV1SM55_9ROSI|nr:unnamed protein product [Dovyalis caffra]